MFSTISLPPSFSHALSVPLWIIKFDEIEVELIESFPARYFLSFNESQTKRRTFLFFFFFLIDLLNQNRKLCLLTFVAES